jgi:outer membrane putative beta-barrel porin/alpha-amylase
MKNLSVALVAGFLMFNLVSLAEASCGSSNCTLIRGSQSGLAEKGRFVVDLSYRYIRQTDKRKGSSDFNGNVDVAKVEFETGSIEPEHHRELRTINELAQLDISYGITEKFTLSLKVPFLNDRRHEHFDGLPASPEFTNQDGSDGFGDITLLAKYAVWQTTKHQLVAGAGVKFATGDFKLLNSEGEINEPTIMPGTGSNDPIISLLYSFALIPNQLSFFASASHRFTTENTLDYEFGDSTFIDGGANYRLNEKINLVLQVNTRISRRDEFLGMDVPNTGVTFINLTPGVVLTASENVALYTHVQIPIYQRVNEVNLVPNFGIMAGISYGF